MCLPVVGGALAAIGAGATSAVGGIPAAVLTGATVAINAVTAVTGFIAAQQQAAVQEAFNNANYHAALAARNADIALLDIRQRQEEASAEKQIFQNRIDAIRAKGMALAETGSVQGVSVGQLLGDFEAQQGQFADSVRHNTDLRIGQLTQERGRVEANTAARIAGLGPVVSPSPLEPVLNFAGPTLNTLAFNRFNDPNQRDGLVVPQG